LITNSLFFAELRLQLEASSARLSEAEAARAAATSHAQAWAQREAHLTECLRRGDTELNRVRSELEAALASQAGLYIKERS
jgi:hypothetical protein